MRTARGALATLRPRARTRGGHRARASRLALAGLLLTCAVPPSAGAQATSAGCGPRRAQTVKLSPTIRIYRVPTHSRLAPDREYACWRHGGKASLFLGYAGSFGWNAAHTTLLKLAPQAGPEPSNVVAWVQRTEGTRQSMSLRSGDVRTGRLIHQTAPPGEGDTISALERGYFIVTPTGLLAWYGKGGPSTSAASTPAPKVCGRSMCRASICSPRANGSPNRSGGRPGSSTGRSKDPPSRPPHFSDARRASRRIAYRSSR